MSQHFTREINHPSETENGISDETIEVFSKLNRREKLVMEWVATGLGMNQIAEKLNLANEDTANKTVQRIFKKFDGANAKKLTYIWAKLGNKNLTDLRNLDEGEGTLP
jgi:DNA-binding NarL/FixJ family response regulator